MYKCADVAVFPSTYEPFGIVALEAGKSQRLLSFLGISKETSFKLCSFAPLIFIKKKIGLSYA